MNRLVGKSWISLFLLKQRLTCLRELLGFHVQKKGEIWFQSVERSGLKTSFKYALQYAFLYTNPFFKKKFASNIFISNLVYEVVVFVFSFVNTYVTCTVSH